MTQRQRVDYSHLVPGYEFAPSSYKLDPSMVAAYLKAVDEDSSLYRDGELAPPMAVAAYAMAALSEGISLPPGTIHVSQELEFMGTVTTKDTITTHAVVSRRQDRGKFRLLAIDLTVVDQRQKRVLVGKTSFLMPQS